MYKLQIGELPVGNSFVWGRLKKSKSVFIYFQSALPHLITKDRDFLNKSYFHSE